MSNEIPFTYTEYEKFADPVFSTVRSESFAKKLGGYPGKKVGCTHKQAMLFDAEIILVEHKTIGDLTDAFCARDASTPNRPVRDREGFMVLLNKWWARAGGVNLATKVCILWLKRGE